jgi:hypothetical protein
MKDIKRTVGTITSFISKKCFFELYIYPLLKFNIFSTLKKEQKKIVQVMQKVINDGSVKVLEFYGNTLKVEETD